MKRSEAIDKLEELLLQYQISPYFAAEAALDLMEEFGMQPPVATVQLVPDENRPGYFKHGPTERKWDNE